MSRAITYTICLLFLLPDAIAFHESAKTNSSTQLTFQAIEAENSGRPADREQLLARATESANAPDLAFAMSGKVKASGNRWIAIDDSAGELERFKPLDDYATERSRMTDNVQGHWEMIQWCMVRELYPQVRAHCNRIIQLQPSNEVALRMLGYVKIGDEWIAPPDRQRLQEQFFFARASFEKYGSTIKTILSGLASNNPKAKAQAEADLRDIEDGLAAPVVESQIASQPGYIGLVGVEWLANIDSVETSRALARLALNSTSAAHKNRAATALSKRPLNDFVPRMLQMLQSDSQVQIRPLYSARGEIIGLQTATGTEKVNSRDFQIFNALIRSNAAPTPPPRRGRSRADRLIERQLAERYNQLVREIQRMQITLEAHGNVARIQERNAEQRQLNANVAWVLSQVTENRFAGNAEEIWQWWDEVNETRREFEKPPRYTYKSAQTLEAPPLYPPPQPACECFVAGTLVQTHHGQIPIESVILGDLVLSQDSRSGNLEWKPVLRCTQRPEEETVIIEIDGDKLRCTPGHLFWLAGKGWVKARELQLNDYVCCADSVQKITFKALAAPLVTYNLAVADNANYFVGTKRVLSHDVTSPRPHRQLRPGYEGLVQLSKE